MVPPSPPSSIASDDSAVLVDIREGLATDIQMAFRKRRFRMSCRARKIQRAYRSYREKKARAPAALRATLLAVAALGGVALLSFEAVTTAMPSPILLIAPPPPPVPEPPAPAVISLVKPLISLAREHEPEALAAAFYRLVEWLLRGVALLYVLRFLGYVCDGEWMELVVTPLDTTAPTEKTVHVKMATCEGTTQTPVRTNCAGRPIDFRGRYVKFEDAERLGWVDKRPTAKTVAEKATRCPTTVRTNSAGRPIDARGRFMKFEEAKKRGWVDMRCKAIK